MKLHVLYNDLGKVVAICHAENPPGKFLPGKAQHTAIFTIPPDLEGLKPHELHRTIRVETKDKVHRLVVKIEEVGPISEMSSSAS